MFVEGETTRRRRFRLFRDWGKPENDWTIGQQLTGGNESFLGGGDVGGFDGMERKIREERRRLLKERQLLEEKWPREEEDEEEGQSHKTLNSDNGKSLEEVAEKWIKTMDEVG